MVENHLTVIPSGMWPELRDLYSKDWPENVVGYYTIDNFIRWIEKLPSIENVKMYSLNGDWMDGTFVVIDHDSVYANSLNVSNDRLTALLSLIDWSDDKILINFLREKHRPAVLEVIKQKNLSKFFDDETILYHMPKEVARCLEINIPNGITVGSMTEEHVKIASSEWSFKSQSSTAYLRRICARNLNVNLTNNSNELIAWCFRSPVGALVALQVNKNHQRQGLGSLTLRLMAVKLAEIGHDTIGSVVLANSASHGMFQKNGFKAIDNLHFFIIGRNKLL